MNHEVFFVVHLFTSENFHLMYKIESFLNHLMISTIDVIGTWAIWSSVSYLDMGWCYPMSLFENPRRTFPKSIPFDQSCLVSFSIWLLWYFTWLTRFLLWFFLLCLYMVPGIWLCLPTPALVTGVLQSFVVSLYVIFGHFSDLLR